MGRTMAKSSMQNRSGSWRLVITLWKIFLPLLIVEFTGTASVQAQTWGERQSKCYSACLFSKKECVDVYGVSYFVCFSPPSHSKQSECKEACEKIAPSSD
jgi:hypothetical protein